MAPGLVRDDPPLVTDELTALSTWLDYHRTTLQQKCEGLSPEQMVLKSVPPSDMTMLGLLRHMTGVEWWWFEHVFAGESTPDPIDPTGEDPQIEWHALDPSLVDQAGDDFARQCARSRGVVDAATSLDALSASAERPERDLRWVMVHMIEEYARHNGHADLLRECIDGVVGD